MNVGLILEKGCAAVLKLAAPSTVAAENIYAAQDSPDGGWEASETILALPCVIFQARSTEMQSPSSIPSIYAPRRCRLRTIIRTQRDDESDDSHRARCAEIFSIVLSPEFRAELDKLDSLGLLLAIARDQGEEPAQRHLQSYLDQDIDCVPFKIG